MMNRRTLLVSATASAALAALGITPSALAASGIKLGDARPFSFDALIDQARALAGKPYAAPSAPPPDVLDRIDYDAHGKIHFRPDNALFADGPGQFPVTFFHLGTYFRTPVRMHVIERGKDSKGNAREIIYEESYFDMPADSPAHKLPRGSGFAGFRFQESRLGDQKARDWKKNDWVAFLGASYFRAIGELYQYGLSARGIAIDVAEAGKAEEFPNFTHIYFEPPEGKGDTVTVYALLDGPSITGAYKFVMQRGKGVVMDVECALFLRKDVARLGVAPLTSMYWFSETMKGTAVDWRPEVHDSDGLAIWNGAGEHIWRPLNNPPQTRASAFADDNPRGFGLLQRDRLFDHYQDGVNYDRRPSLWVEPRDGWGAGAVQLVELRTDDRDPRQHRGHVGAQRAGARGQHLPAALPPALARRRAVPEPAGALRGDAHGQRRPARAAAPAGRAQVHGGVQGRSARKTALRRQTRSRAEHIARQVFLCLHRSRAQRRGGPLAGPVRPDGRWKGTGRPAPVPAARRQATVGNLALPVPPVPVADGLRRLTRGAPPAAKRAAGKAPPPLHTIASQ